ncbi:MAG: CPBP family glutamic-type intramembrane protease [Pseudomonadota bacterium]
MSAPEDTASPAVVPAARLWAELCALYLGVPLAMAFVLPADAIWTVIPAATLVSVILLGATPGFRPRELVEGPAVADVRALGIFAALCAAGAAAVVLTLRPAAFLGLPRFAPQLWLTVLLLYPAMSAYPQEIMYRALFFRRYGGLFPSRAAAVAANALLFGLAHLFLWNSVALAATAAGGAVFAWAYLGTGRGRNLMFATLLHAVAGWAIFTLGAGAFFYHGAVGR